MTVSFPTERIPSTKGEGVLDKQSFSLPFIPIVNHFARDPERGESMDSRKRSWSHATVASNPSSTLERRQRGKEEERFARRDDDPLRSNFRRDTKRDHPWRETRHFESLENPERDSNSTKKGRRRRKLSD